MPEIRIVREGAVTINGSVALELVSAFPASLELMKARTVNQTRIKSALPLLLLAVFLSGDG